MFLLPCPTFPYLHTNRRRKTKANSTIQPMLKQVKINSRFTKKPTHLLNSLYQSHTNLGVNWYLDPSHAHLLESKTVALTSV